MPDDGEVISLDITPRHTRNPHALLCKDTPFFWRVGKLQAVALDSIKG